MPNYSDPTIVSVGESSKIQAGSIAALIAGSIAVIMVGFFFWRLHQVQDEAVTIEKSIAENQAKLQPLQKVADDLTAYDKQVKSLHAVFDNQKLWEVVLSRFEQRLYKRMTVTSLVANETGSVTFSGAVASYNDYAKVYMSLTDDDAKKYFDAVKPVALTKIQKKVGTSSADEVDFTFTVQLNASMLKTQPDEQAKQ